MTSIIGGQFTVAWLVSILLTGVLPSSESHGASQVDKLPLNVQTVMQEGRFCEGDPELMFLVAKVLVIVSNVSSEAIVLDPRQLWVQQTAVGSEGTKSVGQNAESVWRPTEFSSRVELDSGKLWVLKPGHQEKKTVIASFLFARQGVVIPGVSNATGVRLLYIDLATWRLGTRAARDWAGAVSRQGRLWTHSLEAPPMRYEMPVRVTVDKCN